MFYIFWRDRFTEFIAIASLLKSIKHDITQDTESIYCLFGRSCNTTHLSKRTFSEQDVLSKYVFHFFSARMLSKFYSVALNFQSSADYSVTNPNSKPKTALESGAGGGTRTHGGLRHRISQLRRILSMTLRVPSKRIVLPL